MNNVSKKENKTAQKEQMKCRKIKKATCLIDVGKNQEDKLLFAFY